jgi:hypothetical protein
VGLLESAQFPTHVKEALTLLVKSKPCRKAVLHQALKAREIEYMLPVAHTLLTLENDRGELTNRVGFGHVCTGNIIR